MQKRLSPTSARHNIPSFERDEASREFGFKSTLSQAELAGSWTVACSLKRNLATSEARGCGPMGKQDGGNLGLEPPCRQRRIRRHLFEPAGRTALTRLAPLGRVPIGVADVGLPRRQLVPQKVISPKPGHQLQSALLASFALPSALTNGPSGNAPPLDFCHVRPKYLAQPLAQTC